MRTYLQITGVVFAVVALLHVTRLVLDWPVQAAGWTVPMWLSWIGIAVAGALSIWAFRLVGRAPR